MDGKQVEKRKINYRFSEADHLHELFRDGRWVPLTGTSTVCSVLNKPGLTWWASSAAVSKMGWTNPKLVPEELRMNTARTKLDEISIMPTKSYLALLDEAYHAHAKSLKKSAGKGKDMHAELESYVKDCLGFKGAPLDVASNSETYVIEFSNWAKQNVDKFLWSELHTFSEKLWLGGITDCGALLKDGRTVIIDFKSSKDAYSSQFLQIGGYALQIKENGAFTRAGEQVIKPMSIDTFMVVPFGATEFKVEERKDTPAFEEGFKSALNLYRLTQSNE